MKIIDLLNKIANGEGFKVKIEQNSYFRKMSKGMRLDDIKNGLNEEVENLEEKKTPTLNDIRESYWLPIIEEKKIPEKLVGEDKGQYIDYSACNIVGKINEIIDYLKSKGE